MIDSVTIGHGKYAHTYRVRELGNGERWARFGDNWAKLNAGDFWDDEVPTIPNSEFNSYAIQYGFSPAGGR